MCESKKSFKLKEILFFNFSSVVKRNQKLKQLFWDLNELFHIELKVVSSNLATSNLFSVYLLNTIEIVRYRRTPLYSRDRNKKLSLHIMNLQINRPRIPINLGIGSLKRPIFNRTYVKSQIKRTHIARSACIVFCIKNYLFQYCETSQVLV